MTDNWRPSPAPQVGGGGGAGGAGGPGPGPGGVGGWDAPAPEAVDWRSEYSADSRDMIVIQIMETLRKHLPVSGPEGLSELKKIAVRFEEKIYRVASSQADYLRKISLKMLAMETKSNVSINKPSDTVSADGSQAGNANGGDWQGETYQKLQVMKENYIPDLNDMYQTVLEKLQQLDSPPQQPKSEQIEKLNVFKTMLGRIITSLQVPKNDMSATFKDKLGAYEKQILGVLATHRHRT